jgi:hypothetical protein
MDDDAIRARARAMCEALVAGDIDKATSDYSPELKRKLGEVIGLLPLPATEAAVESVEHRGSGWDVLVRVVGEADVVIQTRWKDRAGTATMVEASHLSRKESEPRPGENEGVGQGEDRPPEAGS